MTAHEHDMMHEMILRRAMRSVAESIEPHSDGLDKIHTRLRKQPYALPVAWAEALWMRLTMWVPDRAYSAGHQLAAKLRTVWGWILPEPGSADRDGQSSPGSLLRPLVAFGICVFIVAVGAYVAIEVPAVISPSSGHSTQQNTGHNGQPNPGSGVAGKSSSAFSSGRPGRSAAPSHQGSSCPPTIFKLGPTGGPSTSPSRSASPTPTPTPTGTPTPTPTPTPTGSGTPTPTTSGSTPGASGADQPSAGASAADAQATTDAVIVAAAPNVKVSSSSCPPSPHRTKRPKKKRANHSNSLGITGLVTQAEPVTPIRSQFSSSR